MVTLLLARVTRVESSALLVAVSQRNGHRQARRRLEVERLEAAGHVGSR